MKSLLEVLAALEHQQWEDWSRNLACTEQLSAKRVDRWHKLWLSYEFLTDEQKAHDRMWAKKALCIVFEHLKASMPTLTNLFDECIIRGWLQQELDPENQASQGQPVGGSNGRPTH